MKSSTRLVHVALVMLSVSQVKGFAATLPPGFTETIVASGLSNPVSIAVAPDGRLFVCLQGGQVRVIKDGSLLPTPFLTLTVDAFGERGLLAIAFDPNFAVNQYVYIHYTAPTPTIHSRISRFTANGDIAVPGSEHILFELDDVTTGFHMGGGLHFGPDGNLYVAVGDNERPGGPRANSQTLENLFGKMLRIATDGAIPPDNPFPQAIGKNRAIWALGLRNPFTFAFHPRTGRMFINDVGEDLYEEINEGASGANYGWPVTEGPTTNPDYQGPIYWYGHGSTAFTGCAIAGGAFYNPLVTQFPQEYLDKYFFADYCSGWINTFDATTGGFASFAAGIAAPVDVRVAEDGALYYLARGADGQLNAGAVYKVQYTGSSAPSITQHPVSQTVSIGQSATFIVSASGTPPLSYQWQRNRVNIPGANSSSYTTPPVTTADNGATFRCIVSNAAGSATSNEATLTVTGNSAPVATITKPAAGTLYTGGMTIEYAGTATDAEDGELAAAAFTWYVDFHHEDHIHPFIQPTSDGKRGDFVVPTSGETSTDVWYRIHLTVRDSEGLETSTFQDVRPQIVTLKVATQRSGLQVTVDGQTFTGPYTFNAVVGMMRTIGAITPQTVSGGTYVFESWSDGGAATHEFSVPPAATTYTARYRKR